MFGLLCWANFLLISRVLWENLFLDICNTLDTAAPDLESSLFFSRSKGTWKIIHREWNRSGMGTKLIMTVLSSCAVLQQVDCWTWIYRTASSISITGIYWIVWDWTYIKWNPMIFSYFVCTFIPVQKLKHPGGCCPGLRKNQCLQQSR